MISKWREKLHFTSSDRRSSAWEGLCTTASHGLRSSGAPGHPYPHDISRLSGNQQNDERGVPREDIPHFRTTRLDSRATLDPPKHPKSCFAALSQDLGVGEGRRLDMPLGYGGFAEIFLMLPG